MDGVPGTGTTWTDLSLEETYVHDHAHLT